MLSSRQSPPKQGSPAFANFVSLSSCTLKIDEYVGQTQPAPKEGKLSRLDYLAAEGLHPAIEGLFLLIARRILKGLHNIDPEIRWHSSPEMPETKFSDLNEPFIPIAAGFLSGYKLPRYDIC
jgi:hypothetical protein